MITWARLAIISIVSSILCWGVTGIFHRWAQSKQFMDYPNERSSHTRPTPRGGGISIVLVVLTVGMILQVGRFFESHNPHYSRGRIGFILAGALLIAAISWLDDVRAGLAPALRLAVHSVAAALALIATGGWSRIELPVLGTINIGWTGTFVSLIWIVGLINFYNFMDGIDGIASVQAATAALGWIAAGILSGSSALAAAGLLLGASTVGFLVHNWPPAKVFMGDTGSAFLGYYLAVVPLWAPQFVSDTLIDKIPFAGFLMVAPFVVDATFTLLRRFAQGEKLSQAHRSHLYQRLVITGLSHRTVTLLYMILGFGSIVAGVSFIFIQNRILASLISIVMIVAIWAIPFLWALMRELKTSKMGSN